MSKSRIHLYHLVPQLLIIFSLSLAKSLCFSMWVLYSAVSLTWALASALTADLVLVADLTWIDKLLPSFSLVYMFILSKVDGL